MKEAIDINLKSRRHAIFERVKAKLAASGHPMREDAHFLQLVDRWAEGQIELDEVIEGYSRAAEPALGREPDGTPKSEPPRNSDEANIMADLERVIGMVDFSPTRQDN